MLHRQEKGFQDSGNMRCGRNQVNVMASSFLQLQHHGGQGVSVYLPPLTPVADFPVLAEKAIQVAVGEENGPGTKIAYKLGFLSEMGMTAVEHGLGRGTAVPQFILEAVDATFPGTKITGSQPFFSFVSPLLQFTGGKFEIRRFIIHSDPFVNFLLNHGNLKYYCLICGSCS
jgi:hypothetical protein